MKTILVDDDKMAVEHFKIEAEGIADLELVQVLSSAEDAYAYASECAKRGEVLDFALLDVELPNMNGIELAKRLRNLYPYMVIIFLTGYEQYAIDAVHIKADYYITKPYDREDILDGMERARLLAMRNRKRIYARTFGRFDLFVDGKLVSFTNVKAKELLALCVDHRGGNVTMEEAIDKLWEDREYDNKVKQRYRTTMMQLRTTLREYGADGLFESVRGACHIDATQLECDYYELLEGNEEAVRRFDDEYMFEYSWAEETLAAIMHMLNQ